jgi:phage baseplate assembly protein V
VNDFDVTELDRRLSNLIRLGTVQEVDYQNAKVRIKSGDILTGWLPWTTQRAGGNISWHAPEIGEQIVVLAPSGELNQGVVLPGIYQAQMPAPVATPDKHHMVYSDGAVLEYDRATHHLQAILPDGATVQLISDGGITIKGNITLEGDINMTGTLTSDIDVVANGISLHNHKHQDSQPGTGQTGVPV